jgi:hypothetical protein
VLAIADDAADEDMFTAVQGTVAAASANAASPGLALKASPLHATPVGG